MKRRWLIWIAVLLTMAASCAFAEVMLIMPSAPYETMYAVNGTLDFGWIDLNTSARVEIRDEKGDVLISQDVLPNSMVWSCDAGVFKAGKLYYIELVLAGKRVSRPFYVSFEREQGMPFGFIDTKGLTGKGAYAVGRINNVMSELLEEEYSYTTAISEYLFSTREKDTLLHPLMFIIDSPALGEKGDLNTQKYYLQMMMNMACQAYEDIQHMNQAGQQIGFPYAQELGGEFKAKMNSAFTELFDSGNIEFRYLLNKKIADYADVLLFTLMNRKTGLFAEDAIYMMIGVTLDIGKTYLCLDTDQESIEQYLHQHHHTDRNTLLAEAGIKGVLPAEEAKGGNRVIGSVQIREGNAIHVRDSGSADGQWIGRAAGGKTYECIEITPNGWYKIRLEDGSEGYISGKLATFAQAEAVQESQPAREGGAVLSGAGSLALEDGKVINMPNPQFSERSWKRADALEIQIEQENASLKETKEAFEDSALEKERMRVYRDALIFSTEELNELLWRDAAQYTTENNAERSYVVFNEIIQTFKDAGKSLTGAAKDALQDAIAEMEGNPTSIYVEMWKQLLLKTAMGYQEYAQELGYELSLEDKMRVEGTAERVIDELVKAAQKEEKAAYLSGKNALESAIEANERDGKQKKEVYDSLFMSYIEDGVPNEGQRGGLDYLKDNIESIEADREKNLEELQNLESEHQKTAKGIKGIETGLEVLSVAAEVYSVYAKTEQDMEAYRQAAARQAYYCMVIEGIREATNIPELQQACDILQEEIVEYAKSPKTYEFTAGIGNTVETACEVVMGELLNCATQSCVILEGLETIASTADMLGNWGPAYESGKKLQTLGVLQSSLPLQQVINAYSSDDEDDYYLTELYRVLQLEGLKQSKDYLVKYDAAVGSDVSEMNIGNLDSRLEAIDKGIMTNIEIQSVLKEQHEAWFLTDE